MPKVSVVIPVFNAGLYLRECLDSVSGQSLADIEIFCVDDGSTDDSLQILHEYAQKEPRLTVLTQHNQGAGAARNMGLAAASGEYLSFLDADDFFQPTMLEDAYRKCIADNADIGIYKTRFYNTVTGRSTPAYGLLRTDLVPATVPFSYKDLPDQIFGLASPAPWSKMYRRAFVRDSGLRFQELMRANDFFFTKLAFVKADRITIIDKYLVNYRVGTQSNLQANNHESPLDFYESLVALKDELESSGVMPEVERSFVNIVLSNCLYNLNSLRTPESFWILYKAMRDTYFRELGIDGHDEEYFYYKHQFEQYQMINELSPDAYLLAEFRHTRTLLDDSRRRVRRLNEQLEKIKQSRSYRLAHRASRLARSFKRLIPKKAKG